MTKAYDIQAEDLPETFQDIAELIGLENALALVDLCGGMSLYIPKKDSCELAAKSRKIYEDYKNSASGTVYADLAKKYNYAENHIRRIVRTMHLERIKKSEQLELFKS